MTMMVLITIDDDHDGHDDDVFLAGWGSFEASNFVSFSGRYPPGKTYKKLRKAH